MQERQAHKRRKTGACSDTNRLVSICVTPPRRASVGRDVRAPDRPSPVVRTIDRDADGWVARLSAQGRVRDAAIAELHALLLRAARVEVERRRSFSRQVRGDDHDDLAQQSADDALVAILGKLGDFRGESRFTTWAYKFALYEAGAAMRRRAWQGREIPLESEAWLRFADQRPSPHGDAEMHDLFAALGSAIEQDLTPLQREVLLALALNDVPIDVLADRLHTTRGALYKALHDARQKLRTGLAARGMSLDAAHLEVTP
jgi:RNA polymerase sigma-70 factor (ECF subfamily)